MNSPIAQPRPQQIGRLASPSDDETPVPPSRRPSSDPRIAMLRSVAEAQGETAGIAASLPPTKVEMRNINFFYGEFQALKNINLPLTIAG